MSMYRTVVLLHWVLVSGLGMFLPRLMAQRPLEINPSPPPSPLRKGRGRVLARKGIMLVASSSLGAEGRRLKAHPIGSRQLSLSPAEGERAGVRGCLADLPPSKSFP